MSKKSSKPKPIKSPRVTESFFDEEVLSEEISPVKKDIPLLMLCEGNWFELKNFRKENSRPYDLESLVSEIQTQVDSRKDNLKFIDINFHKQYQNVVTEEIKWNLSLEQFQRICTNYPDEKVHPIITFHGTTDSKVVENIFRIGYIVPGTNGIRIAHGSAYGNGVYSSPHFDKAMYYTKPDGSHVYVLINLVFPGKTKLVPPAASGFVDRSNPVGGTFADGTHTRIVYGLEQLVTADADRVVPIGVMKLKIV
jgi:hypothetical protein